MSEAMEGPRASVEPTAEETRNWIRWAGLAFALLFVVGWILTTFTWDDPEKDQEIVDWYTKSSNRIRQIAGAYLTTLAALTFLIFSSGLSRLVPRTSLSQLVRTFSQLFAALLAAGTVAIVTASATVEIPGDPEPTLEDAALLRMIEGVGFGMVLLGGVMAAGVAILIASYGLRGTNVIPSWLVVAGYVIGAVLLVGGTLYIPIVLLVVWVLAVAFLARPESVGGRTS